MRPKGFRSHQTAKTSQQTTLTDSMFRVTVLLPPSADMQTANDAVTDTFPSVELLRRRARTRTTTGDGVGPLSPVVQTELTERQRTDLEPAYYGLLRVAAGHFRLASRARLLCPCPVLFGGIRICNLKNKKYRFSAFTLQRRVPHVIQRISSIP